MSLLEVRRYDQWSSLLEWPCHLISTSVVWVLCQPFFSKQFVGPHFSSSRLRSRLLSSFVGWIRSSGTVFQGRLKYLLLTALSSVDQLNSNPISSCSLGEKMSKWYWWVDMFRFFSYNQRIIGINRKNSCNRISHLCVRTVVSRLTEICAGVCDISP